MLKYDILRLSTKKKREMRYRIEFFRPLTGEKGILETDRYPTRLLTIEEADEILKELSQSIFLTKFSIVKEEWC